MPTAMDPKKNTRLSNLVAIVLTIALLITVFATGVFIFYDRSGVLFLKKSDEFKNEPDVSPRW